MKQEIQSILQTSANLKNALVQDDTILKTIETIVEQMVETLTNGGWVYFCGNGGSMADAQHLAGELSGRFYLNRTALRVEALSSNTAYTTAIGNDYGYEFIFSRQIEGFCNPGDMVIGISTSGTSKNIVSAMQIAKDKKVKTIGITGSKSGPLDDCCDTVLHIPSTVTPRIQEGYMVCGHIICELVEAKIYQ